MRDQILDVSIAPPELSPSVGPLATGAGVVAGVAVNT